MNKVFSMRQAPWFWSFLGAVLVGIAASVMFGLGTAGSMLSTASAFVVFSVLVGLGQMLVITSGPGNIDLSRPATIALSGGVGMRVMAANNHSIIIGILAVIATGALIGVFNYLLIRSLRIPPIIATLSSSFVLQSFAISLGRGGAAPPPAFEDFALARVGGVSALALVALIITSLIAVVLFKLVQGRSLSALGQNARAANFAGVRVNTVQIGRAHV